MTVAIFAAGCFWGVEDAFRRVPGVFDVTTGYTGGRLPHPTYQQVCSGRTGHAEAVRIEFDENTVGYPELLEVPWKIHDPTTKDRQGPDVGSQYRSMILDTSPSQKEDAERSLAENIGARRWSRPVVTEVLPAGEFYPAEAYHQRYLERNPGGYCHIPGRVLESIGKRPEGAERAPVGSGSFRLRDLLKL